MLLLLSAICLVERPTPSVSVFNRYKAVSLTMELCVFSFHLDQARDRRMGCGLSCTNSLASSEHQCVV